MEKWLINSKHDQKTCASIANIPGNNVHEKNLNREGEAFSWKNFSSENRLSVIFYGLEIVLVRGRMKKPLEKSNGLKRIKRVVHLISHTFSKRKQSQSRHDL